MRFRKKLILWFFLVMFIPTTVITAVVFVVSRKIIEEQMVELAGANIMAVQAAMEQHLFFAAEVTTLVYTNSTVQDILSSGSSGNIVENIINARLLDEALNSHVMSGYFSQARFPIYPFIYLNNRPELISHSLYRKVRDIREVEDQYWYRQMQNRNLMYTVNISERKLIVARKLFDLSNVDVPKYSALFTLEINTQYFNELLFTFKSFYNSSIYILNEYNTIVLGSDQISTGDNILIQSMEFGGPELSDLVPDSAKPASSMRKVGKDRAIVTAYKLRNINWTALSITYLNEINLPGRVFSTAVLIILVVCIIIALLMALWFANTLSVPIVTLVRSMNSIDDSLDINIDYHGHDEFANLIDQYKNMMKQIRELINKLYVSEMSKQKAELDAKNAELQALQAQINPHFLYNTLDSINLYAIKYNAPVICDMIDSLANLFRYTLSSSGAVITLDQEINHTRNYLKLQALRMGDDLRYVFQIPGDLRNVRIVKLVLQPLVENSIRHGFIGKRGPLEITVSAQRDGENAVIRISDNGAGADIAELEELLAGSPDGRISASFAVSNVHYRLRQTFGERCGLHFEKNEGPGLSVIVTIPAVWGE
ncbi:MAG: sensor histidine kinase [Treponema sp.]|jgi:two-component system sensor histidine kinase YesM|nr:sensor histidine kinase [Treponema sp.]